MGNDGGSISGRDDLVRVKAPTEKADPDTLRQGLWTLCALSRKQLRPPIVSDQLGRLYNKEAVIEYLLGRSDAGTKGPEPAVAGHIRGLKDIKQLTLASNPDYRPPSPSQAETENMTAPFMCPLTSRQMDGMHRFVYLATCGCVMSESGLRAVVAAPNNGKKKGNGATDHGASQYQCPLCSHPFTSTELAKGDWKHTGANIVPLNPPLFEQQELRQAMELSRTEQAARKRQPKKDPTQRPSAGELALKAQQKASRQAQIAALTAELAQPESSAPPKSRPRPNNEPDGTEHTQLKKKTRAA